MGETEEINTKRVGPNDYSFLWRRGYAELVSGGKGLLGPLKVIQCNIWTALHPVAVTEEILYKIPI